MGVSVGGGLLLMCGFVFLVVLASMSVLLMLRTCCYGWLVIMVNSVGVVGLISFGACLWCCCLGVSYLGLLVVVIV